VKLIRAFCLLWIVLLLPGSGLLPAHGQAAAPVRDVLLITPTTQGIFRLPNTGVVIEIGYAAVDDDVHLSVTRSDAAGYAITATDSGDRPLARFEMPLVVTLPEDGARPVLVGWLGSIPPETVTADAPAPDAGRWLVVFDAHGLYALPAWTPAPDRAIYVGPLEHYTPALIRHDLAGGSIRYAAAQPIERRILRIETRGGETITTPLPTAARADRYRDRFVPEDLRNPGGFMLLGWVDEANLPELARALRATIPADPDLPAPGVPAAPIPLILPFDCAQDWTVSWGYHHSTPQNRFAVDFAPLAPGSAGVYAAHAGTLSLKRYGTADQMIDVGLAARVTAADGVTGTIYGHLEPQGTLALWDLESGSLPDFEWIAVGPVDQGQLIGVMGRSGYATGPHVHFALWSWDQSLYQPVPLGPLTHFERGVTIPADAREGCDRYRR